MNFTLKSVKNGTGLKSRLTCAGDKSQGLVMSGMRFQVQAATVRLRNVGTHAEDVTEP